MNEQQLYYDLNNYLRIISGVPYRCVFTQHASRYGEKINTNNILGIHKKKIRRSCYSAILNNNVVEV